MGPFVGLIGLLLAPAVAHAQIGFLSPVFRDLNGGVVWGSAGFALRTSSASTDKRPIWRGGLAVFYGPFGGRGDTTIRFVHTVADSSDTALFDPSTSPPGKVTRSFKTSTERRTERKIIGTGGKLTLALGYQHSGFYRVAETPLPSPVAIGGIYFGAHLGPYPTPTPWKRLQWYGSLAGTVVQLNDMAGRVDTLGVTLSTERTVAPEFSLMLSFVVAPNYRILLAGGYQYLRFGSVAYRAVEQDRLVPGEVLAQLPEEIRLESWHVTLGASFAASSLIPGR